MRRVQSLKKTYQCMIHGPALSVRKRNVTLSPAPPVFTTSRRTLRNRINIIVITTKMTTHWVDIIVNGTSGRPNDVKGVLNTELANMLFVQSSSYLRRADGLGAIFRKIRKLGST